MKKISLVIAQGRSEISAFMNSVRNQTLPNDLFELILVTHDTTMQSFSDSFVRRVLVPLNSTTLKRNAGVETASGELICFTDDDVLLPNNFLEQAIQLTEETKADLLGGPNIGFPTQLVGEYLSDVVLKYSLGNGMRKKFVISGGNGKGRNSKNLSTCNLVIKKKTFQELGGFDSRLGYGGEDTEFLYRAEKKGLRLVYHPDFFIWHQRRSFPFGHMKQLFTWGKNNGKLVLFHPSLALRSDFFFPPIMLTTAILLLAFLPLYEYALLVGLGFSSIFGITLLESRKIGESLLFTACFPFHFMSYTLGLLSSYVRLPLIARRLRKV